MQIYIVTYFENKVTYQTGKNIVLHNNAVLVLCAEIRYIVTINALIIRLQM
jgi:hypothetical protein